MKLTGKKEFTLVVREDESTGETGWVIEELTDMFDQPSVARDGYLIAHDLIEHVNGVDEIGGIGEELQAMGGLWNTRGQHCDLNRRYGNMITPHESVANEFVEMARRFLYGEEMGCTLPDLEESDYDEDFNEIWEYAIESLPSEIHSDKQFNPSYDEELFLDYDDNKVEEFRKAAEILFHLGIIKHEKMYGKRFNANSLFYGLVSALDGKLEHELQGYERILIEIDYDTLEVDAEEIEPEWEEEY